MSYQYVPLDRVISKFIRDIGSDFAESDIIEWTGEALEFIGAAKYYEEAVSFVEVKNHQCEVPKGLHSIIQIGRNNRWQGPKDDAFCPKNVKEEFVETCESCSVDTAPDYIILDCNGQPLNDYDVAYYRPYFDFKAEYFNWRNSSMYQNKYSPVRPATSALYNEILCEEDGVNYGQDTFTIIRKKTLRFSFKEGSVAIAHNKQVLDEETGYPLVPDNISYTTAITSYITMKIMKREFYAGREGAVGRLQKAEDDWNWYCAQATAEDKMIKGIDEHQDWMNSRQYLIPRNNQYYGFFGNFTQSENRRWNDPDGRNIGNRYFVGNNG